MNARYTQFSALCGTVMLIFGCLIMNNDLQESLHGAAYLLVMYCLLPGAAALGIAAGLKGLRQPGSSKGLAIAGLVANTLALLPVFLMWALGLMSGLPFTCLQNMASCR